MKKRVLASFLGVLSVASLAADLGPDLLAAARKGQADRVQTLLRQGAPLESTDKEGRTALMLAAQRGRADIVLLLVSKGAKPERRDKQGWTAYGLAVFSSGGGREEVLKALPHPPTMRLVLDAVIATENLYSSCFMSPQQLAGQVRAIQPEARLVADIRDVAATARAAPVELVADGGDAVLSLKVRPRAVCVQQQSSDKVSLEVDFRVSRSGEASPILEKTFGGGIKGLREQLVTSQAQYTPVFDDWAKKHAAAIYWVAVEALLRSGG